MHFDLLANFDLLVRFRGICISIFWSTIKTKIYLFFSQFQFTIYIKMDSILTDQVVVLPLRKEFAFHTNVKPILLDTPEIIDPIKAFADLQFPISDEHPSQFVLGGYGALGLPSASHHKSVRNIRQQVYTALLPEFAKHFPGRRIEMLFDRFSIRRVGTSVSPETYHRDVAANIPGDIIFGGWLNLDPPTAPSPQLFTCVPGNVLSADVQHQGFSKIPAAEVPALKRAERQYKVPPGHIILFNQTIAHKISGNIAKFTSFRIYIGWRITDVVEPLYNKLDICEKQLVPPLPSMEIAPTYALLHWVNWSERLFEFTTRFKPMFIETTGKRNGCVYRSLPGLVETNLAYEPYTPAEISILLPQPLPSLDSVDEPAKKRVCV